jgi:DNA-binding MarR family transcriptional regulator
MGRTGKEPADKVMPESEFVRTFQRLVGEIFRLNGQLLLTADQLSKDLEVSTARWQMIATIRHQPMTAAQIGRRIGISRQSTRKTVNRLLKQNLVELLSNPDHRRSPLVTLTDKGQMIMDTLRDRQVYLTDSFTHGLGLSIEQLETMTKRLADMREHAANIDTQQLIDAVNIARSGKD